MAAEKLRKYELIYLVQPDATDDIRQKVADRVDSVFEEYGSTVLQREDWGKRKLAYEIRKQNKAYYTYLVFIAKPGTTAEIERVLRMLDDCVRWQTIKLEEGITEDDIPRHIEENAAPKPAAAKRRHEDDDDDDDDIDDDDDDDEDD